MGKNYDDIREKGMMVLLAFSPAVIGFFYYILVQVPFIGSIWLYAAPFVLLYYWGWVATVYQSQMKKLWKSVLFMNVFCILAYAVYLFQVLLIPEEKQLGLLSLCAQMFTMPLGFMTLWIGVLLDSGSNLENVSVKGAVISETLGILLLFLSSVIGYFIGRNQEQKVKTAAYEESNTEEGMEPVFSDKQIEDSNLLQ